MWCNYICGCMLNIQNNGPEKQEVYWKIAGWNGTFEAEINNLKTLSETVKRNAVSIRKEELVFGMN